MSGVAKGEDMICNFCKERYGCDQVSYDCPREEKPDEIEDELSDSQIWSWESFIQNKWRNKE